MHRRGPTGRKTKGNAPGADAPGATSTDAGAGGKTGPRRRAKVLHLPPSDLGQQDVIVLGKHGRGKGDIAGPGGLGIRTGRAKAGKPAAAGPGSGKVEVLKIKWFNTATPRRRIRPITSDLILGPAPGHRTISDAAIDAAFDALVRKRDG